MKNSEGKPVLIRLQEVCSGTLAITDDQGNILKFANVPVLIAGHSASIDLNADIDLAGKTRTQIHGSSAVNLGCQLVMSLEIIDNVTQKTTVVVGGQAIYSFVLPLPVPVPNGKNSPTVQR